MDSQIESREPTSGRDGLNDSRLLRERSYIDGEWLTSDSGEELPVSNPADGKVVGSVPHMTEEESRKAVDAAHRAFGAWSTSLPQERAGLLRRWFDLIVEHREDLAVLMTLEQGKPISEARGEIDYAASFVEFYAEESKRANIESVTSHLDGAEVEVRREPVGVAAMITPWNFPSAMITRKAAAAMAAGCTVVLHPSHETPFSATALAELSHRAGIPAGVFNVVTGRARSVVSPWVSDTRVRALSFTGSTEVGRRLYGQCSDTVKQIVLELGGHAPFIVFADAEMDHVVNEAVKAKFATSGQDCLGANRFFVEQPVYQEFCERFAERAASLVVGPGLSDPDIGPLMNEAAISKQQEHVADAIDKGARLLTGGTCPDEDKLYFSPTVLADVSADALIMQEETFGPVAPVASFADDDDVIARANDTEYGLIAYLHTQSPERIARISRALEYGMVAVNRTKVTGAPVPFGGIKQSGIGREGARLGMEAFMNIKYVCRDC